MRSAPIDATTRRTARELLVVASRARREFLFHFCLGNGLYQAVALETSLERLDLIGEAETVNHLDDLPIADGLAHVIALLHRAALQHTSISREKNPVLPDGVIDQFGVRKVIAPKRVHAEQTQKAGETAKVHVQDEGDVASNGGHQVNDRSYVGIHKRWVDAEAITVGHPMVKRNGRSAIDDDVDLGMRHPEGLNEVFHRRANGDESCERHISLLRRQKIAQRPIEARLNTKGA